MSNPHEYNYVQHMNILHGSCELIDVPQLVRDCTEPWYNQTLCKVNESVVRLGVLHGEYHWHKHDEDDEFFFVLSGGLDIEIEGGDTVTIGQHEGYVVPKGMMHRPLAPQKTVVLMVETASIDPKGSTSSS
jgi:mannose-6-phosphate isomerase-like protein (cupin superfamily)